MRIAFISFEAPPDTLVGGIGTYVGQAARMLAERGHEVEVFTGSPKSSGLIEQDGYLTHCFLCPLTFEGRLGFNEKAGRAFASRHAQKPFDVLEGPEFFAEASTAKKLVPQIPLVIKLHMSMTLIREINRPPLSPRQRFKERIKRLLQPVLHLDRWKEYDFAGFELPHLLQADEISAPCREIADITARMWKLDRDQMVEVPYPFIPPASLLAIPVETMTQTVGYVGRLEPRKGVADLGRAIPTILQHFPNTRFLFSGATEKSPIAGLTMQEYLESLLAPFKERIMFLGRVPHARMDSVFRQMDITVLPSLWENFPNACLEAMSAGRGVVGSSAGGMAQQLDEGQAGLLVRPNHPEEIAACVCRLLGDPGLRMEFGRKARARVQSAYNTERIGRLTEESYQRAIRQRMTGGRQWRAA